MNTGRPVFRWAALLIAAVLTVLAVAAGGAVAGTPTGSFARFNECPRHTAGVNLCIYGQTLGGVVRIGRVTVPIERPVVLQGGIAKNETTFAETFVGALNGETLSHSPQKIPGGLLGSPLYVTLELLPAPNKIEISVANIESEKGAGVVLPVRIHLENPQLGTECYIGSSGQPVVLRLETGKTDPSPPNQPISGQFGDLFVTDEFNLIEDAGNNLVDNAFTLPRAIGCGKPAQASLVDAIVNQMLGLPSPDGHNTFIENNTLWEASSMAVVASER